MSNETKAQIVDITPAWYGLVHPLLDVYSTTKDTKTKREIREEFQNMAKAADLWNAHAPEMLKVLQALRAETQGFCEMSQNTRERAQAVLLKVGGR